MFKVGKYNVSILPVESNFQITNLMPLTNHVELWNVFVVGNDKSYILAHVNDPYTSLPLAGNLPNRTGDAGLPSEVVLLFDVIWTKTLAGKQLQFFMSWNGRLYLVNTYPLANGRQATIGAVMFMRAFAAGDSPGEKEARQSSWNTVLESHVSSETAAKVSAEFESRVEATAVAGCSTTAPA